MRITGSTADQVIQALFQNTADLLHRFNAVKTLANVADAERDRLRKYIQVNIPEGTYDDCILVKSDGTPLVNVNADGKHILKNFLLTDVERVAAGRHVVVYSAEVTAEAILSQLQHGKDHLLAWLAERTIGRGATLENTDTYSVTTPIKVDITVIPKQEE